jgi:hypothetical protein
VKRSIAAGLAIALGCACGVPRAPEPAKRETAAPPTPVTVQPSAPPETPHQRDEILAKKLDAVATSCANEWIDGEKACANDAFSSVMQECIERCDDARRESFVIARKAAIEACSGKAGFDACRTFLNRAAGSQASDVKKRAGECHDACEPKARENTNRPKTKAESHRCFRECMRKCTGGRVVPNLDGTYKDDPDEWCGTCDFTCHGNCAVR